MPRAIAAALTPLRNGGADLDLDALRVPMRHTERACRISTGIVRHIGRWVRRGLLFGCHEVIDRCAGLTVRIMAIFSVVHTRSYQGKKSSSGLPL